jgi:hypothetical protein
MADFEFGLASEPTPPVTEDTAPDGVYVHITNHDEIQIGRLIQTFREGPRTIAELQAYADEIQELEDVIFEFSTAFDPATATGFRLDYIGRIVGERRSDRSDEDFRAAIAVRQLINRSNGTFDEMVAIAEALYPDGEPSVRELYPASMMIEYADLGSLDFDLVNLLLQQAKAGGVRLGVGTGVGAGTGAVGSVDGDPLGGTIGSVDGSPAGFIIGRVRG